MTYKGKSATYRRYRNDPIFLQEVINLVYLVRVIDSEGQELKTYSVSGKSIDEVEELAKERYPNCTIKVEEID
jgi:hypothetical protein